MGKGGANPYPFWWASSDPKGTGRGNELPEDYKSKQDKEREYYNEYYKQKSYKERKKEREEEFKRRFMEGEFFNEQQSEASLRQRNSNFAGGYSTSDLHPIFKIKKSSSEEDFKKQYKKLILKHHPDKGGDASMFIKIQEAWESIKLRF